MDPTEDHLQGRVTGHAVPSNAKLPSQPALFTSIIKHVTTRTITIPYPSSTPPLQKWEADKKTRYPEKENRKKVENRYQ